MKQVPSLQCLAFLRNALELSSSKETCKLYGSLTCYRRRQYSSNARLSINEAPVSNNNHAEPATIHTDVQRENYVQSRLRYPQAPEPHGGSVLKRHLASSNQGSPLDHLHATEAYRDLISEFETDRGTNSCSNAHDFNLYLDSLTKLRCHDRLREAANTFLTNPFASTYDVGTANILLQYFVSRNNLAEALALVSTLRSLNFRLDSASFDTLIIGTRNGSGSIFQLNKVLQIMSTDRVPKVATTYNALILAHQDLKLFEEARRWFTEAVRTRHATLDTFSIVIRDELRRNQWSNAWQLLQMMKTAGIARDDSIYSLFLHKMIRHGNYGQIANLLESMQLDGIHFSTGQFNAMLRKAAQRHGDHDIISIFKLAVPYKIALNQDTYDILWQHYHSASMSAMPECSHELISSIITQNSKDEERASMFLRDLSAARYRDDSESSPELVLQATSGDANFSRATRRIENLMRSGNWQGALDVYSAIRKLGVNPPIGIIVQVLSGLLKNRQYGQSKALVASLDNVEVLRHNMHFQTTMLRLISTRKIVEDIHGTIRFLESIGASLDIIFYSAAAWRLYRDNKFREAITLLRYAFGLGLAFDLVVWMILIECYAKTRDLASTIWCLQTMKDNKVRLDSQARRRIKRVIKTSETTENRSAVITARELFEDIRRVQNVGHGKADAERSAPGEPTPACMDEEEEKHMKLASI